MPTYSKTSRFVADQKALTPEQRARLQEALRRFLEDLPTGRFRSSLRVKGVQGAPGVFEMRWDADGRATFQFGQQIREGEPHIIWRRVGSHSILGKP